MMAKITWKSILLACNRLLVVVAQGNAATIPPTSSDSNATTLPTSSTPTLLPTISLSTTPSIISPAPTAKPSVSSQPSSRPTPVTPTPAPNSVPSSSPAPPTFAPTASPSLNSTDVAIKKFQQWLQVTNGQEFGETDIEIYEDAVMAQYTSQFGQMVGEPFVVTNCTVISQLLATTKKRYHRLDYGDAGDEDPIRRLGSRKKDNPYQQPDRQLQTEVGTDIETEVQNTLVLTFTMNYTSRYGIDVREYPSEFKTYINTHLVEVTADMINKLLPVATANQVILIIDTPTVEPTDGAPTSSPSNVTVPTTSELPSTSMSPTLPISPSTNQPTGDATYTNRTSFIIGLGAGLGGATFIVFSLICYMRRKHARVRARQFANGGGGNDESIEVISADSPVAAMGGGGNSYTGAGKRSVVVLGRRNGSDSIFSKDTIMSNPSMVSGGGSGSFSSDSDQNHENNGLKSLQEEFDMHKNQNTELMTGGASLAMTRALMEDEDNMDKNQWGNGKRGRGGIDDPESIEANALCETYDWLRKNKDSTLEERNAFFQQILNKMVYTVRQGLNPSDGTSIIHSCAAMLGLQLENDLPNNVLIVTGLLKTKDTTQGRQYLIEAFEPLFGDIESAAIASSNKGFGFVRFVHPRSVQRALERFNTSEIEVQDVSVMIQTLKS